MIFPATHLHWWWAISKQTMFRDTRWQTWKSRQKSMATQQKNLGDGFADITIPGPKICCIWGFLNWGYNYIVIIHLNRIFHYKPSILEMPPINGNLHMDLAEPYKKTRPNTKRGFRASFEEERLIDFLYKKLVSLFNSMFFFSQQRSIIVYILARGNATSPKMEAIESSWVNDFGMARLPGLVNVYVTMERSTMLMGKSTISMGHFQ